jgi:hypothetical protein
MFAQIELQKEVQSTVIKPISFDIFRKTEEERKALKEAKKSLKR